MAFLQLALFALLIVGPVALAWFKGDAILSYFSHRRQQRRRHRRQRSTQALPVREVAVEALLAAEARRNEIDDRMGGALAAFRSVAENGRGAAMPPMAVAALDDLERAVLARESVFGDYIDIAWLQSETAETMLREVELLREAAIDRRIDAPASQASAHLLEALAAASQRRAQIDQALNQIGSA